MGINSSLPLNSFLQSQIHNTKKLKNQKTWFDIAYLEVNGAAAIFIENSKYLVYEELSVSHWQNHGIHVQYFVFSQLAVGTVHLNTQEYFNSFFYSVHLQNCLRLFCKLYSLMLVLLKVSRNKWLMNDTRFLKLKVIHRNGCI